MRPRVVCVGSLNHDIAVWVPRRPRPDETIHGDRVEEFRGGKGANQIVAAARLGAHTTMIGCVGEDPRGDFLLSGLDQDGVDRSGVVRVPDPTGVALITIDPEDVSIIVVAGANAALSPEMVERSAESIISADVLLLQGEVGARAAVVAARIARDGRTRVVFNPAPFNDVAPVVLPLADVVIVNREESRLLAETAAAGGSDGWAVETVVTTLGGAGSEVRHREVVTAVPGFEATVVDPTGAGDCFAAALAVALAEGSDPVSAARFANAAGSRAVEVAGAQPSMPTRDQVEARLRS